MSIRKSTMSESGSHKKKQKDHHDYHDGESSALNEKLLEGCKNGDLAEVRKLLEIEEVDVNYRKTTNISFEVTISKVCSIQPNNSYYPPTRSQLYCFLFPFPFPSLSG